MEGTEKAEYLIDIRNVSKIYNPGPGEVRALDGVSLRVREGEFLAIVGHSGSGKSTLMNIMGCLDVPTCGEYFLRGEQVSLFTDRHLSHIRNSLIGFIFQSFNLLPSLSALENVELPLLYRGIRREDRRALAAEALRCVGLERRMHHRPCELSGGQQQRVAVARALAACPPVILADEPTGNLDSRSGEEVVGLLQSLNDDGKTIVLITHDSSIARKARRVARITDGRVGGGGG